MGRANERACAVMCAKDRARAQAAHNESLRCERIAHDANERADAADVERERCERIAHAKRQRAERVATLLA